MAEKRPKNGKNGRKTAENGRKVHRGYLVGNEFSRVSSHSPTTNDVQNCQLSITDTISLDRL